MPILLNHKASPIVVNPNQVRVTSRNDLSSIGWGLLTTHMVGVKVESGGLCQLTQPSRSPIHHVT